jgi:O-antigen/teichoic acid export membrane protein
MRSSDELGSKMRSGAGWIYLQGWIGAVLQFVAGIVLARILNPSDFGVFYAVNAYIVLLGQQVNFGIPNALLQAREIEHCQWNSAFWFMEGVALLCSLLVLCLSEWISSFYADTRYASIMRLSCVNFFIMPYMFINSSLLRRAMNYKAVSQVLMISSFFGIIVSICFAFLGFGPYSLVYSGILSSLLSVYFMSRHAPWRPSWRFSRNDLKPLFSFGWRIHLNNSLNLFSNRVDNMIVGSLTGISALGIYDRAFNLSRMPVSELATRLQQLIFTGFSRIQDDTDSSKHMYEQILCLMASAIYPFLLILLFTADAVILTVYGEKWLAAAAPLRIMAFGSFPLLISITLGALCYAQNLVGRATFIEAFGALFTIAAVWLGSRWGLLGISIGVTIKTYFVLVLLVRLAKHSHLEFDWPLVRRALTAPLLATFAAAVAAIVVRFLVTGLLNESSFVYLMLMISVLLISYVTAWTFIFRMMVRNENVAYVKAFIGSLIAKIDKRSSQKS